MLLQVSLHGDNFVFMFFLDNIIYSFSNLNGPYLSLKVDDTKSMNWHGFSNKHENLKISRMMIK